jgi:N-acyl-D-amino-acid deacylase
MVNGRQFVVVAAGGAKMGTESGAAYGAFAPHPVPLLLLCLALAVQSDPLVGVSARQPASSSTLIRGGDVIDGTGTPPRRVNLRIERDTIVEIAPGLTARSGERVIDASGSIVAPGFIDMHSHADRGIEDDPQAGSQVRQGITTAVVGQDGGSRMPISAFYESIDRARPSINFTTSVGHGTVRSLVMGADFQRAATRTEIETMKALVERGMLDGAVGLSSGLEYDPGFYAEPAELVELARVAARHGGYYASHVRDEENEAFAAWEEAIDVGRKAGLPVQISHIKLASRPVWGKAAEGLRILERARQEGLRVMADWYPYTYWQSSIYVLIPDRDFENREKWAVGLDEIGGPQNLLITNYPADSAWNGWTLAQLMHARGTDAVTLVIEMVRAAGPNIGVIGTSMIEADLETFAAHPQVLVCSDGGLKGPHPRGYGAFPRVLARFVRDRQVMTWPDAIARMTGRSAQQVGLTDRGVLASGQKADIVIFDPAAIQDFGTPDDPAQPPTGIRFVIVNGELVLDDGHLTGAQPGRGLRNVTDRGPAPAER